MKKLLILFLAFAIANCESQTLIKIKDNVKIPENLDSYELRYEFYIPIPLQFYGIPDKVATLNSFTPLYPGLDRLDGNNVVFVFKDTFSFAQSDTVIKQFLNVKYNNYVYGLNSIIITTPDYLKGTIWNGSTWECEN